MSVVFLVAFHVFFRMGELVSSSVKRKHKVVQFKDVHIRKHTLQIRLRHYKTRRSQRALCVTIADKESKFCPLKALKRYLKLRGSYSGPLFCLSDGSPVTSPIFGRNLRAVLQLVGLSNKLYKAHSFRIGACTEAVMRGVPEETVMSLGRWSSRAAFRRYIRINPYVKAL